MSLDQPETEADVQEYARDAVAALIRDDREMRVQVREGKERIEALTAERDALREALREIVKARPGWRSAAETALAALQGGER